MGINKTIFSPVTVSAGAASFALGSAIWQRLSSVYYTITTTTAAGNRLYHMQVLDSSGNVLFDQSLSTGAPSTVRNVSQTFPYRLLVPPNAVIKVYAAGIQAPDTVAANVIFEDA